MMSKFKRAACVCLTGVMSVSLAAGSALAATKSGSDTPLSNSVSVDFENVTGKVDLSAVTLQNLSPSVLENISSKTVTDETRTVIVTLEGDCVMETISGGASVAEYLNSHNGKKTLKNIQASQANFLTSLASLGVNYDVVYNYTTVTNAVAISVNTKYISKIKGIAGVKSAVVSETYAYPKDTSSEEGGGESIGKIYETGIYNSSEYVEKGYDGSGMTVAILDTGLDYTHEAFSPDKLTSNNLGMTRENVRSAVSNKNLNAVSLSAQNGQNITVDDLYINDKVPFAYDYADKDADVYPAYSQHGVHVAGIVAGNADTYKDKNGAEKENFKGVAPNAQLVICKVFTDNFESTDLGGATSEDLVAALDDCVKLDVDVINMSLGQSAGFSRSNQGDDEGMALDRVYKSIKKAGISLICAASNEFSSGFGSAFGTNLASNPDSGTVGSPSTFSGALSVASINGQLAPFLIANGKTRIYYQESSDENSVKYDFGKQMLEGATSKKFKYVVVPNIGQAGDYNVRVKRELLNKDGYDKVIAVVKRGTNTFKDKVEIAKNSGADAVIIYNNVAGTIGMSLGDLEEPIPAISITKDAGDALCFDENGKEISVGEIEINVANQSGPYMNDYSSWGTTPDLKIKPEITAHGGEITSTVSGGYDEMSGTSMASPNLAGFVALIRGKLSADNPDMESPELNRLLNQIIMSTATTVLDNDGDPYSPRKQGAGLATLDNVFSTKAYLYTDEANGGAEDDRPKVELGDDKQKTGVYNLTFYVSNFSGDKALTFGTQSILMTETLSSDGLSVAEKAYLLGTEKTNGIPAKWTVNGTELADGATFNVEAGASAEIKVTLTLSQTEKAYIDASFKNGMFVEGFLKLISKTEGQCDLTLPFMGFYGNWKSAPMLDYNCFEIAESQKDTSKSEEEKLHPQVWATQPYLTYYNKKYTVPMGGFAYLQDEHADQQIYVEEEHMAVSCFDIYHGEGANDNYLTSTDIKALYTGLLRNAEVVTYDLYDEYTGELLLEDCIYRVSKAYTSGSATGVPANVKLELSPSQLGLVNNGKYRLNFHFYFTMEDMDDPEMQNDDNAFTMAFYVDYEAPVLVDSRVRYYDYKENNKDKQRVYLDLDVYDNHYAQAIVLCYSEKENETDPSKLYLATEYATPIYNAVKNGTNTVSIDITEFYNNPKYQGKLYLQIDDYALNHSVWRVNFAQAQSKLLPDNFEVANGTDITIGVNESYKVALDYEGNANVSNFTWFTPDWNYVEVQNGEIFGVAPGKAVVSVTAGKVTKKINVTVEDRGTRLSLPSISFGVIEDSSRSLMKATGTVKVNAGQDFKIDVVTDPWYYVYSKDAQLKLLWESSDPSVATVDQNGNVSTFESLENKKGTASITATLLNADGSKTPYVASVTLSVQEPFTISGGVLTAYHGRGGVDGLVKIPDNKNVTTISEEAFKDNSNIKQIIIPKTVSQISERAFINCTALEEVYFIQKEPLAIPDAKIAVILRDAFSGCVNLKKVDLSNIKKTTLDARVFAGCSKLEEVVAMEKIGTMNANAFAGCTSLKEANLTGLHNTGYGVFAGCTSLSKVTTGYYTSIGESIFEGCTALKEITVNAPVVQANAFAGSGLTKVEFGTDLTSIGNKAFYNCTALTTVNFNSHTAGTIGNYAFAGCGSLSEIALPDGAVLGIKVFDGTGVKGHGDDISDGAVYSGTTLMLAPETITKDFVIRAGTTEIAENAFANSNFDVGVTLVIPDSVERIGANAFDNSKIKNITLSANLKEISAKAFAGSSLESVSIPAEVTVIGAQAFENCKSLTQVIFASSRNSGLNLGYGAFAGCSSLGGISLPDLAATGNDVILAVNAFANCTSLTTVDLANVTAIGALAFANCTSLESVDLKNVVIVGNNAFYSCKKLASVEGLGDVTYIGAYAFCNTALANLDLSNAEVIGAGAFYGCKESVVNLTSKLTLIGGGAFASSENLTAINITGNDKFFTEDGVLYRIISGTKDNGTYEVCAYPSAKVASTVDGVKTYAIKEGTVTVGEYSFCGLKTGAVSEVKLPYSIKAVGIGAFYNSHISSYVFESINAPVLFNDYLDLVAITQSVQYATYYSYFYNNFDDEFILHVDDLLYGNIDDGVAIHRQILKISYPTNGTGYDNFVYTTYFDTVNLLGELPEDDVRAIKRAIEGFASAQEVSAWNSLPNNAENKKMVADFAEAVKSVHAVYNKITSEKQLEYLGSENVQKLFDIENALKSVKKTFDIITTVSSLEISGDSTHKTNYKPGEKFDLTGIKIIVIYDDYTTELADISKVTIAPGYNGELTVLDKMVVLNYEGKQLYVSINVAEETEETPEPTGCAGCSAKNNLLSSAIALGLVVCVVTVAIVVRRRKCNRENTDEK